MAIIGLLLFAGVWYYFMEDEKTIGIYIIMQRDAIPMSFPQAFPSLH
jgi:hypothetical protein